jgi:hypothetical protein
MNFGRSTKFYSSTNILFDYRIIVFMDSKAKENIHKTLLEKINCHQQKNLQ